MTDVEDLITAIAATGLPPIKCPECKGDVVAAINRGAYCDGCFGLCIVPRCTCCKADEVRIAGTTLCRECDIDCRDSGPCASDVGDLLLAVAGAV